MNPESLFGAAAGPGVTLAVCDAVATITLDRPAKRNAFGLATWQSLRDCIVEADGDPAVAVIVVRGGGGHFSAGNDIAALGGFPGNPGAARAFGAAWAAAIAAVEDAAAPVLMAIEGVCYGSALALALAGDVRIVASGAAFSVPLAKLGALYLRSDLARLAAAVGTGQSMKLIYSSDVIGAERAQQIGLADEVVPDALFDAALRRLVDTMRVRSPFTQRRSKAMLRALDAGARAALREDEASLDAFAQATQCADFAEGVAAYLLQRTARFSGAGEA